MAKPSEFMLSYVFYSLSASLDDGHSVNGDVIAEQSHQDEDLDEGKGGRCEKVVVVGVMKTLLKWESIHGSGTKI